MDKSHMNHATKSELSKLNHIDLLRGVAVILVVITHVALNNRNLAETTHSYLIYGRVGVQLFFFLSAYTLCRSLDERNEKNYIRNFYIRRFFRIAPLYYFGIAIYWILSNISFLNLNGPLALHELYTPINVTSNFLFIHSFIPGAYNSIVPGGWSIGTEVVFYAIFPLVFLIYSKVKNKSIYYFLPIIALILANIYEVIIYLLFKESAFRMHFFYAFILNQLPVFALGMSYFYLERNLNIKPSSFFSLSAFIVLFAFSFYLSMELVENINLFIFIASISFVFLFIFFRNLNVSFPAINRIGQLSYSIYIFHFIFAYPFSFKIDALLTGKLEPFVIFFINLILTLILSILISILSEKFIEKPGIKLGKKLIYKLSLPN